MAQFKELTILDKEDWPNNVISEQSGVLLIEADENVFVVEFTNHLGKRERTGALLTWAEAEANFVERVAEEDYR